MQHSHVHALARVTEAHSGQVAVWAVALARALQVSGPDLARISLAALLHDIGKVYVPTPILTKPGPLTPEEWAVVKRHPVQGEEILRQFGITDPWILGSVRHHHERVDGCGYPDGLAGDAIPAGARIIAIADAWDAMTSPRPYRRPLGAAAAEAELLRCAGTQFDARYVQVFRRQVLHEGARGRCCHVAAGPVS